MSTFFNIVQHINNDEHMDVRCKRAVVYRDRQIAHKLLVCDYFSDNCLYKDATFERHLRLNMTLFLRISNVLEARYDYFKQK